MRFTIFLCVCLLLLPDLQLNAGPADIRVTEAWVNEAPPSIKVSAAYLLVENNTDKTITLNEIDSPDYERVEIHRSVLVGDTARMQLQSEVDIAANSHLRFAPGDYHLMLFNARKQFRAGDHTSFTLHFAGAIQISVEAEVKRLKLGNSHHH